MIWFSELEAITHGKQLSLYSDKPVVHLVIDSRKAIVHEGAVFFAIAGEHHNGHDYIEMLYHTGLRQFIVEQPVPIDQFPDANFIRVKSTVEALQLLVAHHRKQYTFPVIGITGSNGKTIVKEWLHQLCSRKFSIVKNPGSYNSQIGVPLSVWQLQSHHQLAIFEAGISQPGEMKSLANVIQPTIGLFTTIGTAHDEKFKNIEEKIQEKLKLFTHVDRLIYCRDHELIHSAILKNEIPALSWGFTTGASIQLKKEAERYKVTYNKRSFIISIPFYDQASVENAFHCLAMMIYLGMSDELVQQGMMELRSVPMRLELKDGINQCQVIDDTYNNDLGGLRISIDFLINQKQKKKKSIILSDILQSGLTAAEMATQIASMTNSLGLKTFIGIGPSLKKYKSKFIGNTSFYNTTEEFLTEADFDDFQNELILIKGARSFQFEKIISRMLKKVHGTVMEIDLGALIFNLNLFRSKLNPATRLMVMVKAFAYGSGSVEVANVLQYHRVDYLGVAYADEGIELRRNNIHLPIMVMNPAEEGFETMLTYRLEPEMYGFKLLRTFIDFLAGRESRIHLKLNTGMNRLGFDEHEIDELVALLRDNPNIRVASIFSHLAGSDDPAHDDYSQKQVQLFLTLAKKISDSIQQTPILHLLNTSGILRLPQHQLDMVRLGVGLYGVDPTQLSTPLRPVATLKTIVSQVRELKKGDTIGYGRKGKAINDMTVATIAIGYADGFSRAFSNGVGVVRINGNPASIIGNVCMDMTMVDVTGLEVKEGDEVIIFGKELSIYEVASRINTIPYEILTNTSDRVRRVFVAESI